MRVPGFGPKPTRLMIVGEAPGADEEASGLPFIGAAGKELSHWLKTVGISREETYITNVFKTRPPNNNILEFCFKPEQGEKPPYPPLQPGLYVRPELKGPAFVELEHEIASVAPSLILALGNTACWALLEKTGITKIRGYIHKLETHTVLPTFHPAAVLRGAAAGGDEDASSSGRFDYRAIALVDCLKAKNFLDGTLKQTSRRILIPETLADLRSIDLSSDLLSFDIETKGPYGITCVGLSPNPELALVVPFFSHEKGNWWPSVEDENAAWAFLKEILESPVPKLGHNGVYDMQWLAQMGIRVRNYLHDTMLLHHALYPELPKSLMALGSIYCNEMNWKSLTREEKEDK